MATRIPPGSENFDAIEQEDPPPYIEHAPRTPYFTAHPPPYTVSSTPTFAEQIEGSIHRCQNSYTTSGKSKLRDAVSFAVIEENNYRRGLEEQERLATELRPRADALEASVQFGRNHQAARATEMGLWIDATARLPRISQSKIKKEIGELYGRKPKKLFKKTTKTTPR